MSKKILLADDSITIQKVVSLTLANEDYELIIVGDGDSALKKAKEIKPDLVIADLSMPGMNGYELCEAIKRDEELAGTPVMLLASTFESIDEQRAERVGADGHIVKPFESEELITKIKELLSRPPKAPAEVAEEAAPAPEPLVEEEAPTPMEEEPVLSLTEEPEPVAAAEEPEEVIPLKEEEGQEEFTLTEDIWEPEDFIGASKEEEAPSQETTTEETGGEEDFFDLKLSEDELEAAPEKPEESAPAVEEPREAEPIKEEAEEAVIEEITELTTPVVEEDATTEEAKTEEAEPFAEYTEEAPFEGFTAEEAAVKEVVPPQPVEEKKEEITEEKVSALLPPEKVEEIVRDVARKVIEEVAWDVVPELAEEYIKKEIIDKLKDAISKLK